MKLRLKLFILFITVSQFAIAQDVKVTASINANAYAIGDYIYFSLHATADSTTQIFWPLPEEIASFDIISANPIDTAREKSKYNFNQVIVYSVYDSGVYTIPVIQMQYKKAGDQQLNSVFTDSITFRVHTVAVDTTAAIKPIKGNIDVKVRSYLWLYILLGLLGLATIGFGVYYAFFTKKSIRTILPKAKQKPLHEQMLERLKALDGENLWQKEQTKMYYIELTDILREYMEKRYDMHALESTSDEIMEQLELRKLPQEVLNQVTFILRVADMAKFAKSKPLPNENTLAMTYAINFVETTKPVEEVTTEKK